MRQGMRRFAPCLLVLAWLVALVAPARAEDYVLGSGDVIAVSVWLHPELERTLTINEDGNVTLPPVGDIKAAGFTTKQLSDKIADRLSSYLRQTTTVTVTVTTYMSQSVFVTGGVAKPGHYGFERIPTIIDVLGQAGGAVPGSDLSQVQILRKEGDSRKVINADLTTAIRTGDTSSLPELKVGDTIVVPGASAPGATAAAEGVGVLGEVAKPGVYPAGTGLDIWTALAYAGGVTPRGNWKNVRMLKKSEGGQTMTTLNLRDALDHGTRSPVVLGPGDVVVVMP
ncbi:MAG TPA: polysaccharide biosynthesis/export family protein, partial [Candidatus Acidoferrales bacterium]|nr:polysaccharide biosynthesis/export family protein [Candidatus Acidoferrales bacterium]